MNITLVIASFALLGQLLVPTGYAAEIHERDLKSWSESGPSLVTGAPCANAGGVDAFLVSSASENIKVGLCHFWRENVGGGFSYRQEFLFFDVPKSNKSNIYVGCQIPGLNVFKLAWSDINTGYKPLLDEPNGALMLERIKNIPGRYVLENRHVNKDIIVTTRLPGHVERVTLKPRESVPVSSAENAKYINPYMQPGPNSDCN
jgi:hypothetical protein